MSKVTRNPYFTRTITAFMKQVKCMTCFALVLISILPLNIHAKDRSILILSSNDKSYINSITQNISQALSDSDTQVTSTNSYEIPNSNKHDLIITVGSQPAIKALQDKSSKTPIYSLLIPEAVANELATSDRLWATQVIDQPFDRQLMMIKYLFGDNKKIGVLLGPASSRSRKDIESAAKNLRVTINYSQIDTSDQLIPALKATIHKNDILLAVPDPMVYSKNTIRGILLLTYRSKLPVIGFSKSYIKAGATAGIYSTPEQIAADAVENIKNFFLNNRNFNSNKYHPKLFNMDINKNIVKAMKLKINDKNVLKKLSKRQ